MSHAIVINIPNESTRRGIQGLQRSLRESGITGDSDESAHITLVQFGELSEAEIATISEVLKGIEVPALKLNFSGIEQFPLGSRCIYARVSDTTGQLEKLFHSICDALNAAGLKETYRTYPEFIPHCALANGCDEVTSTFLKNMKTPSAFVLEAVTLSQVDCYRGETTYTSLAEKRAVSGLGSSSSLISAHTPIDPQTTQGPCTACTIM